MWFKKITRLFQLWYNNKNKKNVGICDNVAGGCSKAKIPLVKGDHFLLIMPLKKFQANSPMYDEGLFVDAVIIWLSTRWCATSLPQHACVPLYFSVQSYNLHLFPSTHDLVFLMMLTFLSDGFSPRSPVAVISGRGGGFVLWSSFCIHPKSNIHPSYLRIAPCCQILKLWCPPLIHPFCFWMDPYNNKKKKKKKKTHKKKQNNNII